jgi:3-oxoacyl-[acyl-carrier protein] reductase
MKKSSKVAIITGASRGIGRAIALRLAREGFGVVVNYANNQIEADKVVGEIEAAGGRAIAIQADVSKTEDVARLFSQSERAFGGVDVLVNSAGIMEVGPVADFDDATFDRIFAINVRGTFNTLKQAVKRLRPGGRMINLSTSVIGLAPPGYAPYGASKAAVETLTNIFAKELRGKDLTVNAVAPGPTATELFFQDKSEEEIERLAKLPPLERLGRPEDIAAVVSFLVGPEGGWINGQTIRANGGMV